MNKFGLEKIIIAILIFSGAGVRADGTFMRHEASLLQLWSKVQGDEKEIGEMIKEKNQTTDPTKTHEIVAEIKKLLADRKDTIRKYNKELHHVDFEHPGHMDAVQSGKKEEKKEGHDKAKEGEAVEAKKFRYKRYDEKSIQEFEDEVNKVLSNVYDNVKKKYNQD